MNLIARNKVNSGIQVDACLIWNDLQKSGGATARNVTIWNK